MALDMDFSKLQPHDVLDLAIFAEDEAREQYEHFAAVMEATGNRDVARFFEKMAYREKLHHDQLAERRQALYAGAPRNLANRAVWSIEAPGDAPAAPALTAAAAFGLALAAERRAEEYYAAAREHVAHAEVSTLFDGLRQSEVEHQRMLQLEMARQG